MADHLKDLKADLRNRAEATASKASRDCERVVATALTRLAEEDSKRLGRWCNWFERKRAAQLKQLDPMERWCSETSDDGTGDIAKLDEYIEADKKLRIDRGEGDGAVEIDLAEEIYSLVFFVATTDTVTSWEALPKREKDRRLGLVASLARGLAAELDRADGPDWPRAVELFEIENSPRPLRLSLSTHPLHEAFLPLKNQRLATVLRSLEHWAERQGRRRSRDARMNTGHPYARVLAKAASHWFDLKYGSVSSEMVADIVNLLVPDMDPPATGEVVREWRGVK